MAIYSYRDIAIYSYFMAIYSYRDIAIYSCRYREYIIYDIATTRISYISAIDLNRKCFSFLHAILATVKLSTLYTCDRLS